MSSSEIDPTNEFSNEFVIKKRQNFNYYDENEEPYTDEDYTREIPTNSVEENSDVWDDSALIAAWDDAVKEYQSFHSIKATKSANKNENNRDKNVLSKKIQSSGETNNSNKTARMKFTDETNVLQHYDNVFTSEVKNGKSREQSGDSKKSDNKKVRGQTTSKGIPEVSSSSSQTEEGTIDDYTSYQYSRPYESYPNYYMPPPPPPPPPPQHYYHSFPAVTDPNLQYPLGWRPNHILKAPNVTPPIPPIIDNSNKTARVKFTDESKTSRHQEDAFTSEVENDKSWEQDEESTLKINQDDSKKVRSQKSVSSGSEGTPAGDGKIASETETLLSSSQTQKESLKETTDDQFSSYQHYRPDASQGAPYGPYPDYYIPPPPQHSYRPEVLQNAYHGYNGSYPNYYMPPPHYRPPQTATDPNSQYSGWRPSHNMKAQNIAPPMPPMIDDDSLRDLLMAWYFSGYYTGYYQAKRNG